MSAQDYYSGLEDKTLIMASMVILWQTRGCMFCVAYIQLLSCLVEPIFFLKRKYILICRCIMARSAKKVHSNHSIVTWNLENLKMEKS